MQKKNSEQPIGYILQIIEYYKGNLLSKYS